MKGMFMLFFKVKDLNYKKNMCDQKILNNFNGFAIKEMIELCKWHIACKIYYLFNKFDELINEIQSNVINHVLWDVCTK